MYAQVHHACSMSSAASAHWAPAVCLERRWIPVVSTIAWRRLADGRDPLGTPRKHVNALKPAHSSFLDEAYNEARSLTAV